MYVTLKLDFNVCRIHSISDGPSGPGFPQGPHGNEQIVTNERYVVMRWKIVTRHGKNVTLKEAVDRILDKKESENKELERRSGEGEGNESEHKEYYENHMKV